MTASRSRLPRSLTVLAAIVASLASTFPAQAHGIWFAQRSGATALVYGDGAEDLDIRPRVAKLRSLAAFDAAGRPLPARLETEGRLALVQTDAGVAALAATLDNGLWSKDRAGRWHGKGQDEIPDAQVSGHYLKSAVHLTRWPEVVAGPLPGVPLQILPVGPVRAQHLGEELLLRVYFDGKPLAGARVGRDLVTDPDGERLTSDADGLVRLKIRNQGLNVIHVEHDAPPSDPVRSRQTSHLATLSFSLGHEPE